MKNITVFALLPSDASILAVTERLHEAGFRNTDVSVLLPYNEGTKDLAHRKASKAPEGIAIGAAAGAAIGAGIGWLAGIGALVAPGLGIFVASGPILGALAGAGGLGIVGGVVGGFCGMGVPEYEAKRFDGRVKGGNLLISVHCDDTSWANRARSVLKDCGGEDISQIGEAIADFARSDKPRPRESPWFAKR